MRRGASVFETMKYLGTTESLSSLAFERKGPIKVDTDLIMRTWFSKPGPFSER